MKAAGLLLALPVWLVIAAPSVAAAASPTPNPTPSPVDSPSPIPKNAFLTLDTAAGAGTTSIGVTGSQFLPNERVTLYWDPPSNKVGASVTADANGAFTAAVKPYPGDSLGVHHLCASVPPTPCANFTLTVALPASPVPSPITTPSPSPSPSPTASLAASPSRQPDTAAAGLAILTRPPFVFVPIAGVAAILLAAAYWALVLFLRRPRPVALRSAAIVHRASRPDYTAGFGSAPEPPTPRPQPSAWADVVPAAPAQPPAPPPAAAPPPVYPPVPPGPPGPDDPTG